MPSLIEMGIHAQRFAPAYIADAFTKRYCKILGKSRKLKDKIKFAKQYKIDYSKTRKCSKSDTMESCLAKFPTLNDFFARKLKPEFLPIESEDPKVLVSPAECMARKLGVVKKGVFHIKGAAYTMETLLRSPAITEATV